MAEETNVTDSYAHLKNNAWREIAEIDARLDRGELDEPGWHQAVADLLRPSYLAAETPWEQSGKSGSIQDWEVARSHITDAIDRDGTFLDVGCANEYLMECIPGWTKLAVEPYGLDIVPEFVELARSRLPLLADRIWVGNALTWEPSTRFTYIRTGLEYVPQRRQRQMAERLLGFCDRLIVGVFGEHESERTTEDRLAGWGLRATGRSERPNPKRPGMEYRVLWIDA